jgi:radical SAM-linked protein
MKIKAKFTKGPQVKYISHLDLMKTIEKALRRAQLPIAFSQGFNPHPKISLASALAVGVTFRASIWRWS